MAIALGLLAFDAGRAQNCVTVQPSLTDPAIASFNNVHTACIDLTNSVRGKLFVFLPGTGGIPFAYQQIVRAAARAGYHAIGLMYVNPTSVVELCAVSVDADCNRKTRLEIITGTNYSDRVDVSRAQSIDNRLAKMVRHLHTQFPGLGWNRFVDAQTNVVWSNVVIAGHSQGGGHAALIAKIRRVDRCLMFASMDWRFLPAEGVPSWVGEPGVTPTDRYFGLGHHFDEVVASNRLVANWQALGIDAFAPEHLVDGSSAPYGFSHMLMTALPSTNAHSCMITDLALITNATGSVYLPVWNWMLTGPTELPELGFAAGTAVTYQARSEWRYQMQIATNGQHYAASGDVVTGFTGTVTSGIATQGAASYRVRVDY